MTLKFIFVFIKITVENADIILGKNLVFWISIILEWISGKQGDYKIN